MGRRWKRRRLDFGFLFMMLIAMGSEAEWSEEKKEAIVVCPLL